MLWNVEHAAQWIAGALVSRHFTKDRIWLRQSNFSSQLVQGQSAVRHNGGGPGVVRATPGTQWWQTTSTHQRHQWPFCVITTFLQPDWWTKASRQGAQEKRKDSKGQATVVRDPTGFTGYLIASLAGAAEGLQEPEPQTAAPPERTQEGGERETQKARDAHRMIASPLQTIPLCWCSCV